MKLKLQYYSQTSTHTRKYKRTNERLFELINNQSDGYLSQNTKYLIAPKVILMVD